MIAHIRNGEIVRTYIGEKGRVPLENGDTVSPPVAGYVNGNDRIVPVRTVTVDNSTTDQKRSKTAEQITDAEVIRTTTVSDIPVDDLREGMQMPRGQFCIALASAGVLPAAEAIEAAKGNWPATFNAALSGLSNGENIAAQIEWATAQTIRRNHPLIAMLADMAGLSHVQVDSLFGGDFAANA